MNEILEIRAMLVDSATRMFADHVDSKVLDAAKRDGWSPDLWRLTEEAQLARISIPEEAGGAGGSLSDLAAVLRIAGRFAVPIPLAETANAGWLLSESGLPLADGPLTFGPLHGERVVASRDGAKWVLKGKMSRVPWARIAHRIVVLADGPDGHIVASIDPKRCCIKAGRNLADEPRDDVSLDELTVAGEDLAIAGMNIDHEALKRRSALFSSLLMAGALEKALELSVRYATERVQFKRKIGEFQAIQQELARFAGEVAAAVAAALSAAGAMERNGNAQFEVASAKVRVAQAANEGSLIAHQVHGAIGVTDEYALHHSTLRLWAWREEHGNEVEWARALGKSVLSSGAEALWPTITQH